MLRFERTDSLFVLVAYENDQTRQEMQAKAISALAHVGFAFLLVPHIIHSLNFNTVAVGY